MSRNTGKQRRIRGGNLTYQTLPPAVTIPASARGYVRYGGNYSGRFNRGYGRSSAAEMKNFDTALSFTTDLTGEVPATGQLTLVPQGTSSTTRIGNKITIRSIGLKFTVSAQTAYLGGMAKIVVVQDTQCNGDAATYSGTEGVYDADQVTAWRNTSNVRRFKVLKEFDIMMRPTAGVVTAYNNNFTYRSWFKKCYIPIEYSSTTGAIGEIRSNNIFLLARAATDDDLYNVSGYARLRFTDN